MNEQATQPETVCEGPPVSLDDALARADKEQAVYEKPLEADDVLKSRSNSSLLIEKPSENLGVAEYIHTDETNGDITFEMVQDVEPILEHTKRLHNEGYGKSASGEWYHAGSFPIVVVQAWLNRYGLSMRDFKGDVLKKFLNDSDHSAFRVWKGRV